MAIDPVCGMEVDEKKQRPRRNTKENLLFRAPGCKTAFDKAPEKYVKDDAAGSSHPVHHH